MRVTQKTNYYWSKSGRFGGFFSRGNVAPYGTVWKVVTKVYHGKSITQRTMDPVCIHHNIYDLTDPDISNRIRNKIRSMEDLYYEH